ncbi:hypothetical protein GM3708_39 [Geminocystis sp. NIES-3708]|nr:hypothetical protein GM3708_39 [Geminocystis sp. NIES-3708]
MMSVKSILMKRGEEEKKILKNVQQIKNKGYFKTPCYFL